MENVSICHKEVHISMNFEYEPIRLTYIKCIYINSPLLYVFSFWNLKIYINTLQQYIYIDKILKQSSVNCENLFKAFTKVSGYGLVCVAVNSLWAISNMSACICIFLKPFAFAGNSCFASLWAQQSKTQTVGKHVFARTTNTLDKVAFALSYQGAAQSFTLISVQIRIFCRITKNRLATSK